MKKHFYFVLLSVVSIGSCNLANDDDYANVAEDLCSCVNSKSEDISQGMKTALIEATEKNQSMTDAMETFTEQNPDMTANDLIAISLLGEKIEDCNKDLEVKYKDVYTNESDYEIERRLLEALRENDNCKWTYSLIKIASQEP